MPMTETVSKTLPLPFARQLYPTNQSISVWANEISSQFVDAEDYQVIALHPKSPVRQPEEVCSDYSPTSPDVKVIAVKITRGEAITSEEHTLLTSATWKNIYDRVGQISAYKAAKGLKRLRTQFPVVALGSPASLEIVVKTPSLTMSWSQEQADYPDDIEYEDGELDRDVDIGAWYIGVVRADGDGFHVYVRPVKDEWPGQYRPYETKTDWSYHPHTYKKTKHMRELSWSILCMGDSEPDVYRWLNTHEYVYAFHKIRSQLESYNAAGAFHLIEKYLTDKCARCYGQVSANGTCKACTFECATCHQSVSTKMFLFCYSCRIRSLNCPKCEIIPRCYLCGKYSCMLCQSGTPPQSCAYCATEDLETLNSLNLGATHAVHAIHAISSETQSESESPSLEQADVLGTQREGIRSVWDGGSGVPTPL